MDAGRVFRLLVRHRVGKALYLMVFNLDSHHALVAASAMAFDAFLSLVPLAAFAGYVLHVLHESGDVVLAPILSAGPKPVADLVSDAILRLSGNSGAVVAPLSVVAFLWASSAGISTAMGIFEGVFKSPPRPWYRRRGIAILCVVAAVGIVAMITGVMLGAMMISGLLGRLLAIVVPVMMVIGMLSAFFRISVRKSPLYRRRRVLPGVLTTLVLWTAVSTALSFYVATLARYATLYGGLAAVAIFLFWLWLLSLALLVGGEVNATLDGIREVPPWATPIPMPPPDVSPERTRSDT